MLVKLCEHTTLKVPADINSTVLVTDGSMFSKRSDSSAGYSLLRHVENENMGSSLFNASLKSKYMSPVKLANLPQKESVKERGKLLPKLSRI